MAVTNKGQLAACRMKPMRVSEDTTSATLRVRTDNFTLVWELNHHCTTSPHWARGTTATIRRARRVSASPPSTTSAKATITAPTTRLEVSRTRSAPAMILPGGTSPRARSRVTTASSPMRAAMLARKANARQ